MKRVLISTGLIVAAAFSALAQNFTNGQAASLVLGQANFTSSGTMPTNARSMSAPAGVAVDPTSGKAFVAEFFGHRVLRYPNAASLANGAAAEAVIGQPNFSGSSSNQGLASPTASTLSSPVGVCVDASGTLYVADSGNNRVLVFLYASTLLPITNAAADRVLGQANFTTATSGTTATTLNTPYGVNVSAAGTLFVADYGNNRVLGYKNIGASSFNQPTADLVVGQANFTTSSGAATATGLQNPTDLLADSGDRLWVVDYQNSRVLRYDNATALPANGAAAGGVIGQADLTSNVDAISATGLSSPFGLTMDSSGTLYVSDLNALRVTAYANAAALANGAAASLVLGQTNFTANVAATTAAGLGSPIGLTFDLQGRLFVADYGSNRVLRYTKAAPPATPTVAITGKAKVTTTKSSYKVKGKATGGTITSVKVKQGAKTLAAKGTSSWSFTAKLKRGKNVLTITAIGAGGTASKPVKVTITRK